MLSEILMGQTCRPAVNKGPSKSAAREEDYFYTVVAAWLDEGVLFCAVVEQSGGGTNVLRFVDLEFWKISLPSYMK